MMTVDVRYIEYRLAIDTNNSTTYYLDVEETCIKNNRAQNRLKVTRIRYHNRIHTKNHLIQLSPVITTSVYATARILRHIFCSTSSFLAVNDNIILLG
jgi:hypothetical protein